MGSGKELDMALDKYREMFGDSFPSMEVSVKSHADLLAKVKQCIDKGQPAHIVFNIDRNKTY